MEISLYTLCEDASDVLCCTEAMRPYSVMSICSIYSVQLHLIIAYQLFHFMIKAEKFNRLIYQDSIHDDNSDVVLSCRPNTEGDATSLIYTELR